MKKKYYYIEGGDDITAVQRRILEDDEHGITGGRASCPSEAHIVLLKNYTFGDKVIANLKPGAKYCFGVLGMDEICGKARLYRNVTRHYGRHRSKELIPLTFTLPEFAQLTRRSTVSRRRFILKKDVQRQEGLRIVTAAEFNTRPLDSWLREKFVVVQEFLTNPLLVHGRKANLRVYVLVVATKGVYIYSDGFMYYTPLLYYEHSNDTQRLITSGYVDRYVYEINPLTHSNLRCFLGHEKATQLFAKVYSNVAAVFSAVDKLLRRDERFPVCFQLFGVDVQPSDDLTDAHILEVNKNPDLNSKDEADGALKERLQRDMFDLVLRDSSNDRFIQVHE